MIRLRDVMEVRVESVSPGDFAQTAWAASRILKGRDPRRRPLVPRSAVRR